MKNIPKQFEIFGEIMHIILTKLGYSNLSAKENLVDRLGQTIYQVIKTLK